MIVSLVINTRLFYGYSVLPTLFNIIPVAIIRQWTLATHGEAAASGMLDKEHDRSNKSSMTRQKSGDINEVAITTKTNRNIGINK